MKLRPGSAVSVPSAVYRYPVADGSCIAFEVEARRVKNSGAWWVQVIEVFLLRSPSARPEYATPPFAVVMVATDSRKNLAEFPAQSHDAARTIVDRLQKEIADAPTVSAFLDRYSVPNSLRPPTQ